MTQSPVAIVLSTWNGAGFLSEQLASLLAQTHRDWTLYWRDDGSDDATMARMHEFIAGPGAGKVVDLCDNVGRLGILASFSRGAARVPECGLLAFADQDDVWLPTKLARGVAALAAVPDDIPALYCARQMLVDAELREIRASAPVPSPPGFPGALTQNIATGCTVMLNGAARRLLAVAPAPAHSLHDWWAYLIVSACGGRILFDPEPVVLYRQHAGNAVGVPLSRTRRAVAALRRGPGVFMRTFRAHLAALQAHPELLSGEARQAVTCLAEALQSGISARARALRLPGLRRQSFAETQMFRLWFLLG